MSKSKIVDILHNYLSWEEYKSTNSYDQLTRDVKDDLRLVWDKDANYYYREKKMPKEDSLHADTIISFWTPYKRLLELEAGWNAYKTVKSLSALINQINATWKNEITEKLKTVNRKMEPFAEICYSKGNYMLLPNREMNNRRYQITEDRIDMTLYECFCDGELSKFFRDDEQLKAWICQQKLKRIFVDGDIKKDKINWFIKGERKRVLISQMTSVELSEYLINAVAFVENRNEMNSKLSEAAQKAANSGEATGGFG